MFCCFVLHSRGCTGLLKRGVFGLGVFPALVECGEAPGFALGDSLEQGCWDRTFLFLKNLEATPPDIYSEFFVIFSCPWADYFGGGSLLSAAVRGIVFCCPGTLETLKPCAGDDFSDSSSVGCLCLILWFSPGKRHGLGRVGLENYI